MKVLNPCSSRICNIWEGGGTSSRGVVVILELQGGNARELAALYKLGDNAPLAAFYIELEKIHRLVDIGRERNYLDMVRGLRPELGLEAARKARGGSGARGRVDKKIGAPAASPSA